jgi:hypothetical protein
MQAGGYCASLMGCDGWLRPGELSLFFSAEYSFLFSVLFF